MITGDKKKIIFTIILAGIVCIFMVVIAAYSAQLRCENNDLIKANDTLPVSYTHLDVYKRQGLHSGIYYISLEKKREVI